MRVQPSSHNILSCVWCREVVILFRYSGVVAAQILPTPSKDHGIWWMRKRWCNFSSQSTEIKKENTKIFGARLECGLDSTGLEYGPVTSGGTRWSSWLRHGATSRKVAGLIPDCVTGIFHWHNPSGHTMALALTQPLTEMSTRKISWG